MLRCGERRRPEFNLQASLTNWNEFRALWKNIKFTGHLNDLNEQELQQFWNKELEALTHENEKICVLVPLTVNSINDQKEGDGNTQKKMENVRLAEKVLMKCKELIDNCYPMLSYDYSSLFMGNEKQLLVYRKCSSIERYLSKYRLPQNHKIVFAEVEKEAEKIFKLRSKRNYAISMQNNQQLQEISAQIAEVEKLYKTKFVKYEQVFDKIAQDFKDKPKTRQIFITSMRQHILQSVIPLCQKHELYVKNKYLQCENDQFKDIVITKEKPQQTQEEEQYSDSSPSQVSDSEEETLERQQLQMEPPKEIEQCRYINYSVEKNVYNFQIVLPTSSKLNKIEGLFIRSLEDGLYELSIDIKSRERTLYIRIEAYRKGYNQYHIFLWNEAGFTKCIDKITLFHDLHDHKIPSLYKKRNYELHLYGHSLQGLIPEQQSESSAQAFTKNSNPVYNFSISNSVFICCATGDVAGWGEMYTQGQDEPESIKEIESDAIQVEYHENYSKIEQPCLIMSKKSIRKVSCGTGYTLMLDIFGWIWSMGLNNIGQLGLGHFRSDIQPQKISKFSQSLTFIIDVKASYDGSSFAINNQGRLYRWGTNQVQSTKHQVKSRFGDIINFSPHGFLYKCNVPHLVSKKHIGGRTIIIESGNHFHLALNNDGVLYGWGLCKYLGMGELKDTEEKVVEQIVNPIEIMQQVQFVTAGFDHCIVVKKDGKHFGWGNTASFIKDGKEFVSRPVQVTEYGVWKDGVVVKAGYKCTVIVDNLGEGKNVKIVDNIGKFKEKEHQFDKQILKIECGTGVVGLLTLTGSQNNLAETNNTKQTQANHNIQSG